LLIVSTHAPTQVDGTFFSYDANGNMTLGLGGKVMTYDAENRPLSVSHNGALTKYIYGADGARLKKVTGQEGLIGSFLGLYDTTAYLGGLEARKWRQGTAQELLFYPVDDIRLRTTPVGKVMYKIHL